MATTEAAIPPSSCCGRQLPYCLAVVAEVLCCKRPVICCQGPVCLTCCGSQIICKQDNVDSKEEEENVRHVVALYKYTAMDAVDINMEKGDILIILNNNDQDWWEAKNTRTNTTGYIPSNYVAEVAAIDSEEWYFGALSRKDAQKLLMLPHIERGTFLIRQSEKTGMHALSMRDEDPEHGIAVKHYQIRKTDDNALYVTPKRTFVNMRELVAFYSGGANGLCHKLTVVCPKPKPHMWDLSHKTKDNWEVDRKEIKFVRKLGSGSFGDVWYGKWHDQFEVAIKTLKVDSMTSEQFLLEAAIMKNLRHEKLVSLYAVCSIEEPIYIITEYMPYGSLLSYLRSDMGQHLKLPILIDISTQIASGMTYLEKQQLVHRDLAARNILVGDNNIVKISDFGLARMLEDKIYNASAGVQIPVKWTAPEAITKRQFTVKSDVWSFGVLLMEVITHGQTPYPAMNNQETYEFISRGRRMRKPNDCSCPDALYNIMLQCWEDSPEKRPSFEFLHNSLDEFLINAETQYRHVD